MDDPNVNTLIGLMMGEHGIGDHSDNRWRSVGFKACTTVGVTELFIMSVGLELIDTALAITLRSAVDL